MKTIKRNLSKENLQFPKKTSGLLSILTSLLLLQGANDLIAKESSLLAADTSTGDSASRNGDSHNSSRLMWIEGRANEGKGVGYQEGYTTLAGFFGFKSNQYFPFLDLRGHVFNNGKFAGNAGVGLRRLGSHRIAGGYIGYDYRQVHHVGFNQVSLGLESLGTRWDYRINGYLPVGKKSFTIRHRKMLCEFGGFSGNSLLVDNMTIKTRKREFDMPGVNAEVEFHMLNRNDHIDPYIAAGPYYFHGKSGSHAFGGEARLGARIFQYMTVEVNYSFDNFFHGRVHGQLGLSIPFGKKVFSPKSKVSPTRRDEVLASRLTQPVYRNEIIVVGCRRHKKTQHSLSVAIDPTTGSPFDFIFVNNTNPQPGNGTFENPYNMLLSAQAGSAPGDVIYVFSGDGTSTGMDVGIILQNNQSLLGSGLPQGFATTQCSITIPAQSTGMPLLTNIDSPMNGFPAITLANSNVVAGIHIDGVVTANGIGGADITNANIHDNLITNIQIDGSGGGAIQFFDSSGILNIQNNVISNITAPLGSVAIAIDVLDSFGSVNSTVNITGNSISLTQNAIYIENDTSGFTNAIVENNTIFDNAGQAPGIVFVGSTSVGASAQICTTISGNTFLNNDITNAAAVIFLDSSAFDQMTADVNNNQISGTLSSGGVAVQAQALDNGMMCLGLVNNNSDVGYTFSTDSAPLATFNLENTYLQNVGMPFTFDTGGGGAPISIVPAGTCVCP